MPSPTRPRPARLLIGGQGNSARSRAHSPGIDDLVVQAEGDEVGVQPRLHPGGVAVPERHVECGRRAAEQVLVDPVVPDQVTGTGSLLSCARGAGSPRGSTARTLAGTTAT